MTKPTAIFSMILVNLFTFAGASLRAETTADSVIDRFIEVIGGEAAIKRLRNVESSASMKMPAAGIDITILAIAEHPNKVYTEQTVPGVGVMKQAFNGTLGWASDPIQGDRQLMPGEIKELTKDSSPQWVLGLKDRFPIRSVLSETATEVTLQMRESPSGTGSTETWTFSKETGFLIEQDRVADMGASGRLPVKSTISEYRAVNGIMIPHRIDAENPAFKASMTLEKMIFNTTIDPGLFDPDF